MKKARILPSFLKGIHILQNIASHPDGIKLSEVSKGIKLPPSNASLYLNTLLSAGIVIRDPLNRNFFISPAAINLFRNASESLFNHLIPCAEESMKKLHRQFNENVLLAFQKENQAAFLEHISSDHLMSIKIDPEPDFALHGTAAGRAILAFLPEKEINAYINNATFDKLTENTITDENTLRKVLADTRENGYAFNAGEFEEGIMATAAPIMAENRPIGSLVVQFPALRHTLKEAMATSDFIIEQAHVIEKKLQRIRMKNPSSLSDLALK